MMREHVISAFVYPNPQSFSLHHFAEQINTTPSLVDPKASVRRETSDGGKIFFFNFGAIAFWNVSPEKKHSEMRLMAGDHVAKMGVITEEYRIVEDPEAKPQVEFNKMTLDTLTDQRAEVIAATIAQSATMEHYERLTENIYHNCDQMVESLRRRGTFSPFPGKLHRKIGEALQMRSIVIRALHLLDRPDLIWEDALMDHLYNDLRAVFDLPERFQALEYKLNLIQDTLELLLDTARDRRSVWLESSIVLMIAVELWLTLKQSIYDLFNNIIGKIFP